MPAEPSGVDCQLRSISQWRLAKLLQEGRDSNTSCARPTAPNASSVGSDPTRPSTGSAPEQPRSFRLEGGDVGAAPAGRTGDDRRHQPGPRTGVTPLFGRSLWFYRGCWAYGDGLRVPASGRFLPGVVIGDGTTGRGQQAVGGDHAPDRLFVPIARRVRMTLLDSSPEGRAYLVGAGVRSNPEHLVRIGAGHRAPQRSPRSMAMASYTRSVWRARQ